MATHLDDDDAEFRAEPFGVFALAIDMLGLRAFCAASPGAPAWLR